MTENRIVLATDFSDEARRAYEPTIRLAREIGARVTLVHVVEDLVVYPHGSILAPRQHEPDLPQRIEEAKRLLEKELESLGDDVAVDYEVRSGEFPEKELCSFAEEIEARFIAIASHGKSGLRRIVMGSFTEAVLRQSITPVIVFPRPH